jgi:thiamine biosynthesis lipoprotein ApbE
MKWNHPSSSPFRKGGMVYFFFFYIFILIAYPRLANASDLFKYHQVAMGTVIEITLIGDDEERANKAVLQAFQEIKRIETLMSL